MSNEKHAGMPEYNFVKNSLTAPYFKPKHQKFTQASQTIPDQSLTMRQLFDRYAKGLPLEAKDPVYYGEDDEIPDFKKMDLTEIDEYKKNLSADIEEKLEKSKRRKKAVDTPPENYENKENEKDPE